MQNEDNNFNKQNNDFNDVNNNVIESDEDKKLSKYIEDHRRKEKKLHRKLKKRKYQILNFLALLRFFLICILIVSPYYIYKLKYWYMNPNAYQSLGNTSIKIENNYIVPSEKILRALKENEVPTCPIFLMNTDDIKKSILKISPIQDVYIKRFWFPARIEILVQEREPAITIAPNETVPPIAFYTKDGKIIGRAYLPLNPCFKTVKVLTYGDWSSNNKFDKEKIKFIMTIARDIEQASKEPVQYIDLRNTDDVYVQIPSVKIKLGAVSMLTYQDTLKKINDLPSILPKVKILNKKVKYIDLRWQNNLYYIKLAE